MSVTLFEKRVSVYVIGLRSSWIIWMATKSNDNCFLFLFQAVPAAWLGLNWSHSDRPTPQPQQCRIQAASVTYIAARGNAGSLTHWVRPGIEPHPHGLVRFINHWATTGTPKYTYSWEWVWSWKGVGLSFLSFFFFFLFSLLNHIPSILLNIM